MEDRKTAPALRARLLRSYVPLRCVRTEVRPPAFPPPFPAEISPSQFQIQARRNKDRTLSTATDGNCAPADVCVWKQGDFLLQKRRRDEQVVSVEKVLSLFLSVGFEIIVDNADWMEAERSWILPGGCAFWE